jgi:thioredoxin 1
MIVTDNNFQEVLDANDLILIDFWAEWCAPCKKMLPILEEIEADGTIPIGKINIDENPAKSEEFSIISVPTMVLFKSGVPIHKIIGAKPKHMIIKEIQEWI